MVPLRACTPFGIRVEYPSISLGCGWIGAQRVDICISVISEGVVEMEAALVASDIRVTARTVRMILDGLTRTTLSSATGNVRRTHLRLLKAKCSRSLCSCWMVHYRKPSTVIANVRIPTSTIGVIYFGPPGACKYAHV